MKILLTKITVFELNEFFTLKNYPLYGILLSISKTSRFYIGLAVGLPVFSNISIILTHVQTVLSLQGKATSRNWLNR